MQLHINFEAEIGSFLSCIATNFDFLWGPKLSHLCSDFLFRGDSYERNKKGGIYSPGRNH